MAAIPSTASSLALSRCYKALATKRAKAHIVAKKSAAKTAAPPIKKPPDAKPVQPKTVNAKKVTAARTKAIENALTKCRKQCSSC